MHKQISILFSDKVLFFTRNKSMTRKVVVRSVEDLARVLHQHHSSPIGGHSGWNATYQKISREYFWRGMQSDVRHYVCINLLV